MPLSRPRQLAVVVAALFLVGAGTARASCPSITTCSAAPIVSNANCCVGSTCTLDGTITIPAGQPCDLDFGSHNVVLQGVANQPTSGIIDAGTNTLTIEAATFRIRGGQILARGVPSVATPPGSGRKGGTVTITTGLGAPTCAQGLPSFSMDTATGAPSPLIDVSGGTLVGGGSFILAAAGAICVDAGSLHADGLGADQFGAPGGLVRLQATSASTDVNVGGSVLLSATGEVLAGGFVDVSSPTGAVSLGAGTQVDVSAMDGQSAGGGTVSVVGGTINANGIILADAGAGAGDADGGDGGDVTLDARTGGLFIAHNGGGISVLGAPGGSGGTVTLKTNKLTASNNEGSIVVNAPITAGTTETPTVTGGAGGAVTAMAGGSLTISKTIDATGRGDDAAELTFTAVRDINVNMPIQAQDQGDGPSITLTAGEDLNVNNTVEAGTTPNYSGLGGSIAGSAGRNVNIMGQIDASGGLDGDGGSVTLSAVHNVTVASGGGVVSADGGSSGAGGIVTIEAGTDGLLLYSGDLTVNGMVTASGAAGAADLASIELDGCAVTITGAVNSVGGAASNTVTARKAFTITKQGSLKTTGGTTPGTNTIIYQSTAPPNPPNNTISPNPVLTAKQLCIGASNPTGCLPGCPLCGNNTVEYPETCDTGQNTPPHCTACTGCQVSHEDNCIADQKDPNNLCHYHSCDPLGGCYNDAVPDGTPCGGDACTGQSVCSQGFCASPSPSPMGCVNDPMFPCKSGHPLCDDGNPCTDDSCDPANNGTCRHDPIPGCCQTPSDCPGLTVCTLCAPDNTCANQPNCCMTDGDCDDGNPCTSDKCDVPNHTCLPHTNLAAGTQPGCGDDACFPQAQCDGNGKCMQGDPLPCSSTDPCVVAFCDSVQGCVMQPTPGCCHVGDPCDDAHSCTTDACDPGTNQCTHTAVLGCIECTANVDCDARDIGGCGTSVCGGNGTCTATTPPNCNDQRPGTIDSCVPDGSLATHCEHTCIDNSGCDDGKFCNGLELCGTDGACRPGTPPTCDDGDLCTDDRCDAAADRCVGDPKTGIPGITCHLDMFEQAFGKLDPTAVTKGTRKRVTKLLTVARGKLAKASSAKKPAAAAKQLKAAGGRITALENLLLKQSKLQFDVEKALVGQVHDAGDATAKYRQSII